MVKIHKKTIKMKTRNTPRLTVKETRQAMLNSIFFNIKDIEYLTEKEKNKILELLNNKQIK